jgi:putative ABC transport system ATP-binding protein
MQNTVIKMERITKLYDSGEIAVKALKGIDLTVKRGDFIVIMGSSGSGKSTLMNIMGCLDRPTSGEYLFEDVNVNDLCPNERADIRNKKIGFVFQGFNLLPRTSALENVELPLFYDRTGHVKDIKKRAMEALNRVGLGNRTMNKPNQLSGGEQQRVAIARALVNQPSIVLADEPTGNLDSLTSVDIMSVFQNLNEQRVTIGVITHEPDIAHYAKRIITLHDGMVVKNVIVQEQRNAILDLKNLRQVKEKTRLQME